MNFFKRTVGVVAILSILGLHFPEISLALQSPPSTAGDKALGITKHDPELLAPPEVEIPVETTIEGKKIEKGKMNKWIWIGLGVLAAGALAFAARPKDDPEPPPPEPSQPEPGQVTIKWNEQ